jgi:hypothetical protein
MTGNPGSAGDVSPSCTTAGDRLKRNRIRRPLRHISISAIRPRASRAIPLTDTTHGRGNSEANSVMHTRSQLGLRDIGVLHLTRGGRAPCLARKAVSAWAGTAHPVTDALTLAASELVTNSVQHADLDDDRHWIRLELAEYPAFYRLAVTDPGSRTSAPEHIPPQQPDPYSERGRGLAIVANLSRGRWGSHLLPGTAHRVVWCHIDLDPTPAQLDQMYRAPA